MPIKKEENILINKIIYSQHLTKENFFELAIFLNNILSYAKNHKDFSNIKQIISFYWLKSIINYRSIDLSLLRLFVKNKKIFSPINKFYRGITYKFFKSKIKNIIKKDILINSLNEFDEIILIGSGKGIASVKTINPLNWKRKELKIYNQLLKYFNSAIKFINW